MNEGRGPSARPLRSRPATPSGGGRLYSADRGLHD
jgi:hypothetical protein